MSALPWVPLYVNDFLSDVGHLGNTELGVYTRLLLVYYRDAKPLPFDQDRLRRLAMTFSPEEFRALESVMSEFFKLTAEPDGRQVWRHTRADKIIAEAAAKHATASAKATAAAAARWAKNAPSNAPGNAPSIASGTAYAMPTTTTTTTTTTTPSLRAGVEGDAAAPPPATPEQAPKKRGRKPSATIGIDALLALGVSQQAASDWLAVRKVPLTATALASIEAEAVKAGMDLATAVEIAAAKGWRGFEADWVKPRTIPAGGQRQQQHPHKNAGIAGALYLDHVMD